MADNSDRGNISETPRGRGRKRSRNPTEWKENIAKKKRNLGQAYVSIKTGKEVRPRRVGQPCRDGCFTKITMPVVNKIHKATKCVS